MIEVQQQFRVAMWDPVLQAQVQHRQVQEIKVDWPERWPAPWLLGSPKSARVVSILHLRHLNRC